MSKIELGQEEIEYQVSERSGVTEPRIDVDVKGVRLALPEEHEIDPENFLQENADWVLEKKQKYDQYREQAPDRNFEEGEQFPFIGEDKELVIESRQKSEVVGNTIRLRKSAVDQASVKKVLRNFYRRQARGYLTERVEEYAEKMEVEYEKIQIRNQRTRWGSCSSKKTLGLNWRLMMMPPEVIDYVVIHELAHLKEKNHTERFWRIVRKYDPDYVEHGDWLDGNSARMIFSEEDF